ncbi:MAG: Asp-tRNA(Asn)/Glu-tRNA(Gln) amidotransferase subunit GatC [Parachlamydiaceae bacterium]
MSKIDLETIRELSELARIDCTQEEQQGFVKDLQGIFAHFETLTEVDTEGVKPLNHILETMVNVEREDEIKNVMPVEDFFQNVPDRIGTFVKVPKLFKGAT